MPLKIREKMQEPINWYYLHGLRYAEPRIFVCPRAARSNSISCGGGPFQSRYPADTLRPLFCVPWPGQRQSESELRLDIEAEAKAALKGGRYAIVPGDPAKSEIYKRVTSTNKALRMPPAFLGHDAVPAREIEFLRPWMEQGAKYESHWAFIPPRKAALPTVSDPSWAKNPSILSF